MAEGARLESVYTLTRIEGSNPSLTARLSWSRDDQLSGVKTHVTNCALVAQLDRVPGYEPGGRRFESSRARHLQKALPE